MSLPSGTVTFLLTDVEGSTRGWEDDRAAMAEAVARHYDLLGECIARHGGVRPEEQGEGDSVVAAFSRASDAVAAALEAQVALAQETGLAVRMALHTGEAELRDDKNYVGPTIIRTARLRALAHGGQILVSATTADVVADRLPEGAALLHRGTHRLKDLTRPERVFQLAGPGLRLDFPPLRSVDAVPNNLPLQQTSFIGRDSVMEELGRLLDQHAMVTLTGAGGSGKTRLAIQVAAERLERHPDGLWLVDLGPVSDPGLVPNVVASALGVSELPLQPLVETLAQRLEHEDALVIFDNCEHLLDACVDLAGRLLRSSPHLTILATSREPLGIDGEAVLRLPSLAIPGDVGDKTAEAFRLFVDRATLARSNFALDEAGAIAVVEICRRLDGIPLAIELAAARCRALSPAAIAEQLSSRFALLGGSRRGALPRQRTLEASVDWSYELLAEDERTLLRRLSVFAGSFTLGAAEAVCATGELSPPWIVDGLTSLVDKSLVNLVDDGAGIRYRMLETVRFFAGQRLVGSAEAAEIKDRHLRWCIAVVEAAEPELFGPDMASWLERVQAELDNLRAAHDWAIESGRLTEVLRMAAASFPYWVNRHSREFVDRLGELVMDEVGDPRDRAVALMAMGWALWNLGELAPSARYAAQALAIAEGLGDPLLAARAKEILAWQLAQGLDESAPRLFHESIEVLRPADDRWFLLDALSGAGLTRLWAGDFAGAGRWFTEARQVADRHGNPFEVAGAYGGIGLLHTLEGRFAEAAAAFEISLPAAQAIDDDLASTGVAVTAAVLAGLQGQPWREDLARARAEAERRLNSFSILLAVFFGCWLAHRDGPPGAASEDLDRAEAMGTVIGIPWATAICGSLRAELALDEGDTVAARRLVDDALALARSTPFAGAATHLCLFSAARVARAEGDLTMAEDVAHEALQLVRAMPRLPAIPEALELLAALAADQESDAEACRLLAASDSYRAVLGYPRPRREVPPYEAVREAAAARLGPEAFASAWDEGRRLSIDDAVAYATRARGERRRPSAGWPSLTPTELHVAVAVREGLSNPQIAQRLFISRSTVKTHLEHIFAKLGIASRAELAAEVARRR